MYEMWKIEKVALLGFLIMMSVRDMRVKKLPVSWLTGGTLFFLAMKIVVYRGEYYTYIAGAMAGGSFFLIGKLTKEKIGYGDCWILSIMGMVLGIWKFCVMLMIAFTTCALIGIGGIIFGKWNKKKKIPFVPFILAGYMGAMIW